MLQKNGRFVQTNYRRLMVEWRVMRLFWNDEWREWANNVNRLLNMGQFMMAFCFLENG